MAKIFSKAQMDEIYAYFKDKMNSLECIKFPEIKPFNECSLGRINEILDVYYQGLYTLDDIKEVWSVGDTRTFHLSEIANTNNMGAYQDQDISFTIVDFDFDTLTTPVNGKTKALLSLVTTSTFSGMASNGATDRWDVSDRRTWLNNQFYNALDTKDKIKQVVKKSISDVNGTTTITTNDYCWLLGQRECTNNPREFPRPNSQIEGNTYTYYKTVRTYNISSDGIYLRTIGEEPTGRYPRMYIWNKGSGALTDCMNSNTCNHDWNLLYGFCL